MLHTAEPYPNWEQDHEAAKGASRGPRVLSTVFVPVETEDGGPYEIGTSIEQKRASELEELRERKQERADALQAGDLAHAQWAAEQARKAQVAAIKYTVALTPGRIGFDMPPTPLERLAARPRGAGRPGVRVARRGGDSGDSLLRLRRRTRAAL